MGLSGDNWRNMKCLVYATLILCLGCVSTIVDPLVSDCSGDDGGTLNLVYPTDTTTEQSGINFQWTTSAPSTRLQIARDENFNDVLLDTSIATNSYFIQDILDVGIWYWKIESEKQCRVGKFEVISIYERFVGSHLATAVRYCWPSTLYACDSSYQTSIDIVSADMYEIRITENSSQMDKWHVHRHDINVPNELRYDTFGPTEGKRSTFIINTMTDSFFVTNREGGMLFGTIWKFKGKIGQ